MKILITGSNGLLGQKLVYLLKNNSNYSVFATSVGENRLLDKEGYTYFTLDITNENVVERVFSEVLPDVVINTAAMTNVDVCETKKEEAYNLNVIGVQNQIETIEVLNKAYGKNIHFIHLSTDFIFDGTSGPYKEEDKANPLSYYAVTKLQAEELVIGSKIKWCILRTVLVYGIVDAMSRSNIVLWVKQSLEKKQTINVVNDQFRTPTLAEDLAIGCKLAADKSAEGIYNISGKDFMSIYELACTVADYYKLDKTLIKPITTSSLNQAAKRPPVTGFDISKARKELGYEPHSFLEGIKILEEQIK